MTGNVRKREKFRCEDCRRVVLKAKYGGRRWCIDCLGLGPARQYAVDQLVYEVRR